MVKVELKGVESLSAFQTLQKNLIAVWFLPLTSKEEHKTASDFIAYFDGATQKEKNKQIDLIISNIDMDKDEVLSIVRVTDAVDANGIKYDKENISNIELKELVKIIREVFIEISKIKVFF